MSLTASLRGLIRTKPITDGDLHRAAVFTLDAVANALAGRKTDQGKLLLQWGMTQGQDAGRQAFVMGGCAHILETDDLHRASVTHPGCVVVAAALAVADRQGTPGRDVLVSILHGYEAMCRVGNAVGAGHYRVWHNTATCGPYGSAMAVAALLDLDDEKTVHALGNAGTQSAGLWQFLETGAMSKHLHAGRAAEAGVVAADLAALGFTGPPEILEGEKGFFAGACPDATPSHVLDSASAAWQLAQTSIKPWPCCRHTHPTIDAALELYETIDGQEIDAIRVETYAAATDVCDRPVPESEYEAKFSLHHCAAAALSDGKIGFDSFDAGARDRLAWLRSRTSVAVVERWESAYPDAWGGKVTLRTVAGNEFFAERRGAMGDPDLALDDRQMVAKARLLLQFGGVDSDAANSIIDGILQWPDATEIPAVIASICAAFRDR